MKEVCCDSFKSLINNFGWYSYDQGDQTEEDLVYLMPYITNSKGDKIRINYCPLCGKEIRNIKLSLYTYE